MPIYEFENEDGVIEEHFFPMKDAPSIGSKVVIDERLLRRLPPHPQISVERDHHFVAYSQPTCEPDGSVAPGVVPAPRYDMDPKSKTYRHALFASKGEVKRYVKDTDGRVTYGE